jgi:hypothetical protein
MTASSSGGADDDPGDDSPEVRLLFHRLSNELGIILAHGELLEAKAADEVSRARARQVVASALDAMGTVREIRARLPRLPRHDPSAS